MKSIIGYGLMLVGGYVAFSALAQYGLGFDHFIERCIIAGAVYGLFKAGDFVLSLGE